MKILIVGFQRSGTSLLRDLVERHPDVKKIFHETAILSHKERVYRIKEIKNRIPSGEGEGTKQVITKIDFDLIDDTWGEKMVYFNYKLNKEQPHTILDYCSKWKELFNPEYRIIHITRGLDKVVKSNVDYNRQETVEKYTRMVPKVRSLLQNYYSVEVSFETLVAYPDRVLDNIYHVCSLSSNRDFVRKILRQNIWKFGYVNSERQ